MNAKDDRPPEARSAYAQLKPANEMSVVNNGTFMRSTHVQTSSKAGLQSTSRLDSRSLPSTPTPMQRNQNQCNKKNDRSTPTRALTPGFVVSNARWTPTLQESQERSTPGRVLMSEMQVAKV